jgi:SAM-dependent methyltransferase
MPLARFVGMTLGNPQHEREVQHDARLPLPVPDGSVEKIQSQDVFEHLAYDELPGIFDNIYRALKAGGVFRLSLPDYNAEALRARCVFDERGKILCDLRMGGSVSWNSKKKLREVSLLSNGNSHLWFPTQQQVAHAVERSTLRLCGTIKYYHYYSSPDTYVVDPFPDNEMPVMRAPPRDMRAGGKPVSIIADFIK